MLHHPLFDQLDSALDNVVPKESVKLQGEWLASTRRTYASPTQSGTGDGPFVEVVDHRWHGSLICSVPIAGVVFLLTATYLSWVKSERASLAQQVDISLHAYADYANNQATFAAQIGGVTLPSVPVACGTDVRSACTIGPSTLSTGRSACLAHTEHSAFFVLLFPGHLLKSGRNGMWHLRDECAAPLSPHIRELLTRRRTGTLPVAPLDT